MPSFDRMSLGGYMKTALAGLIVACSLLAPGQIAHHQGPTIRVFLINGKSGKPMPGWRIDLVHFGGGPWDSAITDAGGMVTFRLPSPPPPRVLLNGWVNVPAGKGVRYEFGPCADFSFCTRDVLAHGAVSDNYCRKPSQRAKLNFHASPGVIYLFGRKVGGGEIALSEFLGGGAPGPRVPWSKLACPKNTPADWGNGRTKGPQSPKS